MALKNLFDMAKADKYTADGREALIKAQEAETEDKVYQIGEISQKTGLQKTANGWVKPKNGKQPGAKQEEPKNVHGAEVDKIYERQLKRIKELKAKGFTDEQIDNDKIIKQTKEDMKNVGKKPESKPAPKSLAGTPMKKADLNSKDPYEITHSMKPDTASEAKEMDKISAFMQEETGATLRNAITARESFYKNTKNPTPEQKEGLAALMKIQQKLGYGKPAEGPALNGQKKTVSHQEYRDGPMYGPAEETKPETTAKFETEQENAKYEEGRKGWETVSKERLPDIKKKVEQKIDYYKKYDPYAMLGKRTGLNAAQKKAVEQNMAQAKENLAFFTGQLEGINEQMGASDSDPRVLTGDTRIRVRKA